MTSKIFNMQSLMPGDKLITKEGCELTVFLSFIGDKKELRVAGKSLNCWDNDGKYLGTEDWMDFVRVEKAVQPIIEVFYTTGSATAKNKEDLIISEERDTKIYKVTVFDGVPSIEVA